MRLRPHLFRPLALAVALGLLLAAPSANARSRHQPQVVEIPGLGPMLLMGPSARAAVRSYVAGLERRRIYPGAEGALAAWGQGLAGAQPEGVLALAKQEGRPLVGIQLNELRTLVGGKADKAGARAIAAAVTRAGGQPVFLPPGAARTQIERLLTPLDHLILAAGDDVHPKLYRRPVTHAEQLLDARDRYEQKVIRRALARGLGIDGICRGQQLLNVTFGGTLFQDLILDGATTTPHRGRGAQVEHAVTFDPDTRLGELTGVGRVLCVSRHHQAVERLGKGLRVAARAPDGIIEAVETLSGQVRGYQFHPEARADAVGDAIFSDVVRRALRHRAHAASSVD